MKRKIKKPKLKYLYADQDRHGNIRFYVEFPGCQKVRIREEPYDLRGIIRDAFMAVYKEALEGDAAADPKPEKAIKRLQEGTFDWLIHQYFNSQKFRNLSPTTQADKKSVLLRFAEIAGPLPFSDYRQDDVERSQAKRATTPGAADKLVKYLRALFNWAIKKKFATHNPAVGVELINTDSEGWHTWTQSEIQSYRDRHSIGTKPRLAFEIYIYTGVRKSDAVKLGRQHEATIDGEEWLSFVQTKNSRKNPKRIEIPLLPQLREIIDQSPTGDLTYLVTRYGRAFTANGFGNKFREWCDAAGLYHCSAHGIRKAAAAILAEEGATASQLKAVFGWAKLETAETYVRKADTRRRRTIRPDEKLAQESQAHRNPASASAPRNY